MTRNEHISENAMRSLRRELFHRPGYHDTNTQIHRAHTLGRTVIIYHEHDDQMPYGRGTEEGAGEHAWFSTKEESQLNTSRESQRKEKKEKIDKHRAND